MSTSQTNNQNEAPFLKQARRNMMRTFRDNDDLVGMKETVAQAATIEEAYALAEMSRNEYVKMYVDHLASVTK